MAYIKVSEIWAEMARRKVQFHKHEHWRAIRLWGLFNWGTVKRLLDRGLLITDYTKENKTIWVQPSEQAYHKHIEPLLRRHTLDELKKMAGW